MGNNYSEPTEGNELLDNPMDDEGNQNNDGGDVWEKTFSQKELDRVVQKRVREVTEKYSDYDDIKTALENSKAGNAVLREISQVLSEGAGITGTPTEQIEQLKNYYGLSAKQAERVVKEIQNNDTVPQQDEDTKKAVAYFKAEQETKKFNNEEIAEEYERILEIPENKRSAVDNAKLDVMQDKYNRIRFGREVSEARKWYEKEIDGNFDDVMRDEEFIDFAKNSKQSLKEAMKTYLKLVGKNQKKTANPGSAKTTGTVKAKDYYTPEEVDKLTSKDLDDPKIFAAVRKSMTKWK